MDLSKAWCRI